jgi:hypothetical protein
VPPSGKIAILYIHNPIVVDGELHLRIKVFDAGRLYLIVAKYIRLPAGSSIEFVQDIHALVGHLPVRGCVAIQLVRRV